LALTPAVRIAEFSRAADAYQRKSLVACFVPLSVALICLLVYAPLRHKFESFLSSRFGGTATDILTTLPMAIPLVLAFASMIPLGRRIERRAGIACPKCGKNLASPKAIVIASRNCPFCGERVIRDET
jgi:predicted RNA-binding Zn-ribbon protein involved in translation (DUF1610 family)